MLIFKEKLDSLLLIIPTKVLTYSTVFTAVQSGIVGKLWHLQMEVMETLATSDGKNDVLFHTQRQLCNKTLWAHLCGSAHWKFACAHSANQNPNIQHGVTLWKDPQTLFKVIQHAVIAGLQTPTPWLLPPASKTYLTAWVSGSFFKSWRGSLSAIHLTQPSLSLTLLPSSS